MAKKRKQYIQSVEPAGLPFWMVSLNRVVTDGEKFYRYITYESLDKEQVFSVEVFEKGKREPVNYMNWRTWYQNLNTTNLQHWRVLLDSYEAHDALMDGETVVTISGDQYIARELTDPAGDTYRLVFWIRPTSYFSKMEAVCELREFQYKYRGYQFMIYDASKEKEEDK